MKYKCLIQLPLSPHFNGNNGNPEESESALLWYKLLVIFEFIGLLVLRKSL